MGTTSLIVELVIIGFQVLIWIGLLIGIFFNYNWIPFNNLKDWVPVLTIALIAVSYTLGVIFDNFATILFFSSFGKNIKFNIFKKILYPHNIFTMQIALMSKYPDVHKYLERVGYVSRLTRATIINILLICFLSITYVIFRTPFSWKLIIFICVLSIIFVYLAIKTWKDTLGLYSTILKQAYEYNFPEDKKPK